MNHIYADREALIRAWIGLIAFTLLTVLFSIVAASSDSVAALIIALFFFLGDLVSLRVLNRGAARIRLSDNTLTRRGYLAGFSKTVPTDTITRVVHIESKLFGNRLYLIDEAAVTPKKPRQYLDPERKDSVISFTYSNSNLLFLRQFYQGEIESAWERKPHDD